MTLSLTVLNGPNLNLLGEREPEIYGSTTLEAVERSCRDYAGLLGVGLRFLQSNREGDIVEWIHEERNTGAPLIINPAGFSFNSIPVLDALKIYSGPIIELHISNIHARDELHRHSIVSSVADTVICGAGVYGYILALQAAARMANAIPDDFAEPVRVGPV